MSSSCRHIFVRVCHKILHSSLGSNNGNAVNAVINGNIDAHNLVELIDLPGITPVITLDDIAPTDGKDHDEGDNEPDVIGFHCGIDNIGNN